MTEQKEVLEAIRLFLRGPQEEPTKVRIKKKIEIPVQVKTQVTVRVKEPMLVYLKIRRSLDGNYMIFDHPLFDIVVMPRKNKIVTFSKKNPLIDSYPSQDKFFDYLMRKGVILGDTIQGGNVFGSLEAIYPINDEVDILETLLLVIYHFLSEEVSEVEEIFHFDDEVTDNAADPDEESSTELGEVPHAKKKGSIDPNLRPYGLIYRI